MCLFNLESCDRKFHHFRLAIETMLIKCYLHCWMVEERIAVKTVYIDVVLLLNSKKNYSLGFFQYYFFYVVLLTPTYLMFFSFSSMYIREGKSNNVIIQRPRVRIKHIVHNT
jgi:hypothetical protein